jgi:AbrB family looped-hinge helix DNA binding protein
MSTTKLSSKGQVIIPARVRASHHWEPGQELVVIDTGDGVLLKPKSPFPKSSLDEVAGCLKYEGRAKTLEEMDEAIRTGVAEQMDDCG